MMVTRPRLNGKKLVRNYNIPLRLRCQHCGKINRTRHLDQDVNCKKCWKIAKRATQETKTITEYNLQHREFFEIHVVLFPDNAPEPLLP